MTRRVVQMLQLSKRRTYSEALQGTEEGKIGLEREAEGESDGSELEGSLGRCVRRG